MGIVPGLPSDLHHHQDISFSSFQEILDISAYINTFLANTITKSNIWEGKLHQIHFRIPRQYKITVNIISV